MSGEALMPTPADEHAHRACREAPVARGAGPIGDWRETWLAVTLAVHELEGVLMLIRRQFP
jgi:hypothetical protein